MLPAPIIPILIELVSVPISELLLGVHCRTRRGGATRRRARCDLSVRGPAIDTFPKARPVRAHKWNRCDRRRRLRARTRSYPVSRARTWPDRFLTSLRKRQPPPTLRDSTLPRARSCIRRRLCAVALRLAEH